MLHALAALLLFQLAGETVTQLTGLPIPGPVLGMALLFAVLAWKRSVAERLRDTASGMLQHLSLLFVPAGVGVMLHAGRVAHEWLAIGTALLLGAVVTLAVTALTIRATMRLQDNWRRGRPR
jgi:holin-like protein